MPTEQTYNADDIEHAPPGARPSPDEGLLPSSEGQVRSDVPQEAASREGAELAEHAVPSSRDEAADQESSGAQPSLPGQHSAA